MIVHRTDAMIALRQAPSDNAATVLLGRVRSAKRRMLTRSQTNALAE